MNSEIRSALKSLRMSGIVESLEIRNQQAVKEQLSYTDFLSLLLQDEISRRDQRKFATRVARSGISCNKSLEAFDFEYNEINKSLVYDIATCRFSHEKANVLILGPCGTGKSHLAQAFGNQALRIGQEVLFITMVKLLNNLHAGHAIGMFQRRLGRYARIPLLIIDDFGLKPINPPFDDYLHELIYERYEKRATIFTSNLDLSEWVLAFDNKLLGSACVDRIKHNAYILTLEGKSFRVPKNIKNG